MGVWKRICKNLRLYIRCAIRKYNFLISAYSSIIYSLPELLPDAALVNTSSKTACEITHTRKTPWQRFTCRPVISDTRREEYYRLLSTLSYLTTDLQKNRLFPYYKDGRAQRWLSKSAAFKYFFFSIVHVKIRIESDVYLNEFFNTQH